MGEPTRHQPVLLDEVLELLAPAPGGVVVDATLGGGGYTAALAERVGPAGRVLAIDRDSEAVERARVGFAPLSQVSVAQADFRSLADTAQQNGFAEVDAVIFDLGLSSDQLEDPERGFSFQTDGPLDMRMDQQQELSAHEIVNRWPEKELARVLFEGGETRWARRIARAIVYRRRRAPLQSTRELSALVGATVPRAAWPRHIDPATLTFQALRIAVNDELGALNEGLPQAISIVRPGGRIGVVSFHSLEDSAAKVLLNVEATACICPPRQPTCTCAHRASIRIITRKPVRPSAAELERNPRARSARLRVAERLAA